MALTQNRGFQKEVGLELNMTVTVIKAVTPSS